MVKLSSKIKFLFKNKTLIKGFIYHFKKNKIDRSIIAGTNLKGKYFFNYKFDCTKPKTFNEIICWLKFNYDNKLWKQCADKLGSKKFLIDNGLEKYVINTYKTYNSSKEINLDELPDIFVLKTNHDSGTVFICEKGKTNFENVFLQLDKSLERDYSKLNGEWVYHDIKPLIFAEEFLEMKNKKFIVDYKMFCFNGKYKWGYTGQNRLKDSRFCVFENDYDIQNVDYIYLRPKKKDIPSRPECFREMIDVAEKISRLLDFVRVDFFDTVNGPKIGELTFFSQSGFGQFTNDKFDFKYGKCFENTKLFKLIHTNNK